MRHYNIFNSTKSHLIFHTDPKPFIMNKISHIPDPDGSTHLLEVEPPPLWQMLVLHFITCLHLLVMFQHEREYSIHHHHEAPDYHQHQVMTKNPPPPAVISYCICLPYTITIWKSIHHYHQFLLVSPVYHQGLIY